MVLITVFLVFAVYFVYRYSKLPSLINKPRLETLEVPENIETRLRTIAIEAKAFCKQKNLDQQICFLIDMKRPSGKKRFFIYNLQSQAVLDAGLVAHGSCNTRFLRNASFSNVPGCGCSSVGKYKVGIRYKGQFGQAYKLHGLDSTNSNAFSRYVVLHAYDCVPDEEVHPLPICNSLGCPMLSYKFLEKVQGYVSQSKKPVLMWVFE